MTLGDRPGLLLDRVLERRFFSEFARGEVYDEAANAFATHYDDGCNGWQGEYWGKTMLSCAGAIAYTQDANLRKWALERTYEFLDKFQQPNGYIGTYREDNLGVRKETDAPDNFWNFNIWSRKYTLWALVELNRATGDRKCLAAAERLADHLVAQLKRLGVRIELTGSWAGISSMTILKPLLLLHQKLPKPEYLDLARQIVASADVAEGRVPVMNLIRLSLSDRPIVDWFGDKPLLLAKSYEMMSFFEGLAEYYRLTRNPRHLEALKAFHRHLMAEELNPMRSVGIGDHFLGARQRVNGLNELCDVTHWIRLNRELWQLTGESAYLDCIEEAFYNAFLPGVQPDGAWAAHVIRSHGSRHLSAPAQTGMKFHQCCPDNMPRTFFDWADMIATRNDDGALSVNLYSDADVVLPDAEVRISGGYPIADTIRVSVSVRHACKVKFRVPGWSRKIRLDGKAVESVAGWFEVRADEGGTEWSLAFDMTPRLLDSPRKTNENVWVPESWDWNRPFSFMVASFEWNAPENRMRERTEPAAQVMRGPLVLAKGRLAGTACADTLNAESVNRNDWRILSLTACERNVGNASAWGSWRISFEKQGVVRTFPVADFWSVSCVNDANNWYSLWF